MDKYAFPVITNAAFCMKDLSGARIKEIKMEYSSSSKEELYHYASDRKIIPFVAFLMERLGIDYNFWGQIVLRYRSRNGNIVNGLDALFAEFQKAGIRRIFVSQNFGALLAGGCDLALFASGDVDLCADLAEAGEIREVFEKLGYVADERYTGNKLLSTTYYNESLFSDHFGVNVEYEPLSRLKLPCPISYETFLDWTALRTYPSTAILLPPAEALLYICLVHISLHSFSRAPDIRLYVDIANCVNENPDWQTVIKYAEKDCAMMRVLTTAYLARRLLDVDLCENIVGAITSYYPKMKRIVDLVYDESKNVLKYEPGKLDTLKIEIRTDDFNHGLKKILFPDRPWLKEVYGGKAKRSIVCSNAIHLWNLM